MEKKKLIISFSGGRTSAYMTWWLINEWEDRQNWEMLIVFANTGKEVEGTLFFVDECSQEWGIPITWVEATHKDEHGNPHSKKGWQVKHKIVTYETASRNGEPFEEMLSLLGIPSTEAAFCSPQLKRQAIKSFAASIGWKDCHIAIGVRWDEQHRVNPNWIVNRLIYPFIFLNPTLKREVVLWWEKQLFDLNIHPDDGNCDDCWKKDDLRLVRNYIRKPRSFDWWENMTNKYGYIQSRPAQLEMTPPFNFFRGNKSVLDISKLAELSQAELKQISMFQTDDGCGESCEVF